MDHAKDTAAIIAVMDAVAGGLRDRSAEAVVACYEPDATIFDLAPPLSHPIDATGLAAWIEGWEGPIEQDWRDPDISVGGDLAVVRGLVRISATSPTEGRAVWWQRVTACLRRHADGWKIMHEHSSVPFHMDGSFRAAIDLTP